MKGVMDIEYHQKRLGSRAYKYRLRRRSEEVVRVLKDFLDGIASPLARNDKTITLLDIGTADALMLNYIQKNLRGARCVGLDYSLPLLKSNTEVGAGLPRPYLLAGDAIKLPFKSDSFDAVIATAVIEHVAAPEALISECHRVLRNNGIAIFTTPVPFFDTIASLIGHVKGEDHNEKFTIKSLAKLLTNAGLEIVEARRFMISPVGFPVELFVEGFLRKIGADFFLLNQLVVAKKKG